MNAKLIRPHKLFQLFLHLIVMPNAALQYKNSLLFFFENRSIVQNRKQNHSMGFVNDKINHQKKCGN